MIAALVITWTLFLPVFNYTAPITSEKKGLANAWTEYGSDCATVGATWQYFWSPYVQEFGNCEGVPMIWDETQMGITINGAFDWVMGFNEPERPDQANMTPELAAELWRTIEQSYSGKRLVSPAIVNDMGWLVDFRGAYYERFGAYPKLDALAVHCYLPTSAECQDWVSEFIQAASEWGIQEVWVTEFMFTDPAELEKFTIWLEANPRITRYAYFTNRQYMNIPGYLIDASGMMTPHGIEYAYGRQN